jgi:signal transduction histidine kinase
MQDNLIISSKTIDMLWRLQKLILDTPEFEGVVDRVVNAILTELGYLQLGYRILVLTLVDQQSHTLKRIALSETGEAEKALQASPIPFEQIAIPLSATDNLLIRALNEKKPFVTHYWPDIFRPVLTDEAALGNQNAAGIRTSLLYPLLVKDQAIGVMIFSLVKSEDEVTPEEKDLIARFTDIAALAVQHAKLYSELKQANERLLELDKLKDEFVSLASHELRTPMTAIRDYSWILLHQSPDPQKAKQHTEVIFTSAERLLKLVNNMLNVSRIEAGRFELHPQSTHLEQIAKEVVDEVLPVAQNQQLTLTLSLPEQPLPLVLADVDRIKEVLMNLIGNALKFTPAGGTITISFAQQGDLIATSVKDTGKGLRPEDMSRLFQKFGMIERNYQSTTGAQGTGLGLYLSKAIIQMHGGSITVSSEGEGKGTTFTFTLKRVE